MSRYERECRFRFRGDVRLAQTHIPAARNVLGLLYTLLAPGVTTGSLVREVSPGVVVRASLHDGMPIIEISVAHEPERELVAPGERWGLWVPQGFVLYPASDTAPNGWGLPVVPAPAGGPYDTPNLAPGLDTARWTNGGRLGQVLLTNRPDADYPEDNRQALPLMYTPDTLFPAPQEPSFHAVNWQAFRIELSGFAGNAFKRELFELFNEHRASISAPPLELPPRWRFDSAQASARIMNNARIAGHFSEQFPATWQRPDDRVTHDGLPADGYGTLPDVANNNQFEIHFATANPPVTVLGADPEGFDITYIPNLGPAPTAAQAMEAWLDSTPHRDAIESAELDPRDDYLGFAQVGISANQVAVHLIPTNQWVHTGNRQWSSSDPAIPPLSWDAFPSLNLTWETLPWGLDPSHPDQTLAPTWQYRNPFSQVNNGFPHTYVTQRWDQRTRRSAMSRNLYMRGRCIGTAPKLGLIWAAAIQTHRLHGVVAFYRVVILTHHEDDIVNYEAGPTDVLRVWYVDLPPSFDTLPANPQALIRGVYGEGGGVWPWDTPESPYAWRGGEQVNVQDDGAGGTYLKYNSQWVFDSEGRRAICLRSYGDAEAYRSLRTAGNYRVTDGLRSDAIQLVLSDAPDGGVTATVEFWGAPACETVTGCSGVLPDEPAPLNTITASTTSRIIAAGYDEDDNPKFCFVHARTLNALGLWTNADVPHFRSFAFSTDYNWVPPCAPVGDDGMTLFDSSIRMMAGSALRGVSNYHTSRPAVVDVKDEVVVVTATPPRYELRYAGPSEWPNYAQNPDHVFCWVGNTSTKYISVRAWRKGIFLGEERFANKGNTVPMGDPWFYCYQTIAGSWPYWVFTDVPTNPLTMPTYAVSGGEWVLNYILTPQPHALTWYDRGEDFPFRCAVQIGEPSCAGARPTRMWHTTRVNTQTPACAGGYSYSSIADHDGLVSITNTPGANPRFLYARAV